MDKTNQLTVVISFHHPDGWGAAFAILREAKLLKLVEDRSAIYLKPMSIEVFRQDASFQVRGEIVGRHDVLSRPLNVGLIKILDSDQSIERRGLSRIVFWMILGAFALVAWYISRG